MSPDEEAELEEAAASAIEEKQSGETSDSSTSIVEEPETFQEEETEEAPEESGQESSEASGEPEEETPSGTVHIVRAEDNLYRIAIRYYGSGSSENIRKIQDANNGVDADSLTVGQELVIPE